MPRRWHRGKLCSQRLRQRPFRLLDGEWLEQRTAPAVTPLEAATPLTFGPFNTAQASHFLSVSTEFDLYSTTLQSGDTIDASISAQQSGSGLASLLRVFNANGTPLALDNQQGGDPQLAFQAAAPGVYYIGVSSAPDESYDPRVSGSGALGATTGAYTLNVRLEPAAPPQPDLTGASFRTGVDMAAAGDAVPVSFSVQNRGAVDPGNFQVRVLLADTNIFDDGSVQVLATLTRSELVADATGRSFSTPAGFRVTLPSGVPSGPAYLGTRIVADPSAPEAGLNDKSGVHRGADWDPLTVVTRTAAGATDLSQVDPGVNTEVLDTPLGPGQVRTYTVTVGSTLGDGDLKAEANATNGTLVPWLTLSAATGQTLIQSDSGQLVQSLQPGTYFLTVSAQSGAGAYRLTTSFTQTSQPFAPLATGEGPASVAVGDVNGDGYPDIIIANRIDDTVSVFLGTGYGTFLPPKTFGVGPRVWRVTVGDANGDGKLDILTGNKGANTVSILLGNGDGTFQPQMVVPAGTRVAGALVAHVNGDGIPDLVVDNYAADTISVLLGTGGGEFGPPTDYSASLNGQFQGVLEPTVADVNGDGIPDLIYPTYVGGDVVVRLGTGDGTFGSPHLYPAKAGAYHVQVVDLNGDGIPDIVCVNAVDNSVSVLLGSGNGTFQPERVYPVGANPYSMIVADVNGDGVPDIITSNRNDNTVSVLLGKGDGTFQPQEIFQTGKTPRRVAAGDFNGDGHVDLVTANEGDNTVSVLFGNGDGTFSSGSQQAAPAPNVRPFQVAVADLNGDGIPDIVTANRSSNSVGVLLRNADGSFQTKETFATGLQPFSVAIADVNGDGIPDIVTANYAGDSVSVLLGNGDGTFRPHVDYPAGSADYNAVLADLTGDGKPDIVVTDKNDNTVGVLLNNGNGTFQPMKAYPVASGPYEVVVDDVNHDGIPDLVVSHFSATVVDVLLGNGDGTFRPTREFPVGSRPYGLAVADVNGDGNPDIVTANYRSGNVSVLLGNGDGTFGTPQLIAVGKAPNEVKVADLNGDGIPDLVVANYGSPSVSVLLGNGNGTFQPQRTFPAGIGPASVAIADLNGDGVPDLVVGNRTDSTVNVLVGNGDGTFRKPIAFGAAKNRYSVAVADVNGDGNSDLVTTSVRLNTVTVRLGNGDGTFGPGASVAVGPAPTSVAVADLNGDGRADLVTTNSDGADVSVLLGNGDGTFGAQQTFAVGRSPRAVKVADLNGDGIPDLVVANYNDGTVSVLLGKGDGTFLPQEVFQVGERPYSVAIADVNGDGRPDIIVANSASDSVSVLLNLGGTRDEVDFAPQRTFAAGRQPFSVAVADVNGDGKPDVITANAFDSTVSVLAGNGDGTFQPQQTFAVGSRPYSVAVGDVNGDGKPELVTTNYGGNSVSVLLNDGGGAFRQPRIFTTDLLPVQTVVADVNGDGRPDLITVGNQDSATGVLLGKGDGTFLPAAPASGVGLSDTPFLADLNADGTPDSIVLDRSGNILFRAGLPGGTNAFAPPLILNPGRPARAITVVKLGLNFGIAAADAHFDPVLSVNQFVFTVSIYTVGEGGAVFRRTAFSSTILPTSLTTADLTGNGVDDLITANALDNSVGIALQTSIGQFASPIVVPTGVAPSAIAVADVNRDGLPDIIVSDQASGDVTVVLNDPPHSFSQSLRFRAGTGLDGLNAASAGLAVASMAQSVSLVAGDFTGDGRNDLAVVDQGTHSFTILKADGVGGFANPELSLTTSTSDGLNINDRPRAIVAGDFNRDGHTDLAVLMEDTGQVWIYLGNGNGTFRHTFSIAVGDQATGLSVVPGSAPGLVDLLVGNGFGDVLILDGKGDGTFQIRGNRVSLSVVPNLLGPGEAGVLVGNQQDNRVTVQAASANGSAYAPVQTVGAGGSSGQLAPGDVQWAVLDNGATLPDAIVVSTGSNAVVVYRTTGIVNGAPAFAPTPRTYFVGTAPASVTVVDINGDGIPDLLIADQGSNDVSVLFGSYDAAGNWTGAPGPRLKSGGDGPIQVLATDLTGEGIPDLAVVNGGGGTVTMIPAVGRGFFDDQHPRTLFNFGSAVVQPPTFAGAGGVGYAVTAGGDLIRFDLNDPHAGAKVVFSGQRVVAAQALSSGQVVAALADGNVDVLVPRGSGLAVASELLPQGDVPTAPSAIQVVSKSSGLFDVLVSSEGSDNLSVFAQGAAPVVAGTPPPASAVSSPAASTFQAPSAAANPVAALTASTAVATASATSVSASTSASTSSGSLSAVATSAVGMSLGHFTSLGNGATEEAGDAILVPVEGNTYFSVPVLDFGSEADDEADGGARRMPWLWTLFDSGDMSPLTRFVVGLEDARQTRRGTSDEAPAPGGPDPWAEDLFHQRLPLRAPRPVPVKDRANESGGPAAVLPDARLKDLSALLRFGEDHPGESHVSLHVASAVAASLLMTRAFGGYTAGYSRQGFGLISSNLQGDRRSMANRTSREHH